MKHILFFIFIAFTSININADDVNEIASAYATQTSDLQVNSSGTVVKLISDDNKGSRHQRFILKLSNNQIVLVAHNIDLAPKITSLRRGDIVEFNGEYEWNNKGGVIHWTQHDPAGRHQDGWLNHNGSIYE